MKNLHSFERFIIAMLVIAFVTVGFGIAGFEPPLIELANFISKP